MNTAQQEIFDRARRLLGQGIKNDLGDVLVLGDVDETSDIGVAIDLGPEMRYAFFRRASGEITTSDSVLIEFALEKMRRAMVLDDLADV